MFCMSEHSLDQRNEDRLVQGLPVTSAGQTEEQRPVAEQGSQRFTPFPPKLTQQKICPTTVGSRTNKNIYRNSDNCTTKLPFFSSFSSVASFSREIAWLFGAINPNREENLSSAEARKFSIKPNFSP